MDSVQYTVCMRGGLSLLLSVFLYSFALLLFPSSWSSDGLCQFRKQLKMYLFVKDYTTAPSDSCF